MSEIKPDANGWLPISTAPRDRPILTYRAVGLVAVAEYFPHSGAEWCVTDGIHIINVTHWQPIPRPPIPPSLPAPAATPTDSANPSPVGSVGTSSEAQP